MNKAWFVRYSKPSRGRCGCFHLHYTFLVKSEGLYRFVMMCLNCQATWLVTP